ncbi:hypothetical protein ABK040_007746 [Willaertia magna]
MNNLKINNNNYHHSHHIEYKSPVNDNNKIDLVKLYIDYKKEMIQFAKRKPNRWAIKSITVTEICCNQIVQPSINTNALVNKTIINKKISKNNNQFIPIRRFSSNLYNNQPSSPIKVQHNEDQTNNLQKNSIYKESKEINTSITNPSVNSLIIINSTPLEIKKEIDEKEEKSRLKRKRGRPKKNSL